jgi:RNA polymerase sigma factor (TIGR02999 family)
MDAAEHEELTQVLDDVAAGDESAAARLLPLVYQQLRGLARARMAKTPPGQTLEPTALVHEAYLRVAGRREHGWAGRFHFFHAASRAMRDILVEQARRKASLKHGGGRARVELDDFELGLEPPVEELLDLNEALKRMEREHPDNARIVMLRYFTGLTNEETADVLGMSTATVERKWRFVRAWLRRHLAECGETNHT